MKNQIQNEYPYFYEQKITNISKKKKFKVNLQKIINKSII